MEKDNFYTLNIGQQIYYKGEKINIDTLYRDNNNTAFYIGFEGEDVDPMAFLEIMEDLSFYKPKKLISKHIRVFMDKYELNDYHDNFSSREFRFVRFYQSENAENDSSYVSVDINFEVEE